MRVTFGPIKKCISISICYRMELKKGIGINVGHDS